MMCMLSATNSAAHFSEEDNVDSTEHRIVTSVDLPQTPPDSDSSTSPTIPGVSNEYDAKNITDGSVEEHIECNDPKQIESAQNNDTREIPNGDTISVSSHIKETTDFLDNTARNESNARRAIIEPEQDHGSPVQKLGEEKEPSNNEQQSVLSLSSNQLSSLNSCHNPTKSKVLSVELPPTPPTMVDEISLFQRQRRRNAKSGKRRLRLSTDDPESKDAETNPYCHNSFSKDNHPNDRSSVGKSDSYKNKKEDNGSILKTNGMNRASTEDVSASDMSSEEEDELETEKVLDVNPFNSYKRVLVKNGEGGWLLQFVSPCGKYRFNSQKELELNLGQNVETLEQFSTDIKANKLPSDPFAQKLTILRKRLANGLNHFLRQSLDECALRVQRSQTHQNMHFNTSHTCAANNEDDLEVAANDVDDLEVNTESQKYKETKVAQFTFVNMRQNIFDMTASKRKRMLASCGKGIKGKSNHASKEWLRRNSIAAIHCSTDKISSKMNSAENEDRCHGPFAQRMDDNEHNEENMEIIEPPRKRVAIAHDQSNILNESYQVCKSIITSSIYSCVDKQYTVENRLPVNLNPDKTLNELQGCPPLNTLGIDSISSNVKAKFPNNNAIPNFSNENIDNSNIKPKLTESQENLLHDTESVDICNRYTKILFFFYYEN